jgi:hypothetical protein
MDATLYTGTGSSLTVSNVDLGTTGFQPDLVWIKSRSAATDNKVTDSVRGATKAIVTNSTASETTDTQGLTAFGTSGFTLGTDTTYNNSGATYVGWQWKAGGTAVSNTTGSITSSVSANTTAGFSVVTYTGTGVAATVGHGLGIAPYMIVIKERNVSARPWPVYFAGFAAPTTSYIYLNNTTAVGTGYGGFWNSTAPTSSVFSIGTDPTTNESTAAYVAYCWTPIAGFSQFGSYTGNGSADGTFVYTGFRPKYILVRKSSNTEYWYIYDTSRNPYNVADHDLIANVTNTEGTFNQLDFVSNGIKFRSTASATNQSGETYIYACFAENPFKYANAR